MSQGQAEMLMDVIAKMMGLDTSIHREEIINEYHTLRVRMVEILPEVWVIATERWSDDTRNFHIQGTVTSYSEFGGRLNFPAPPKSL